MAETNTPGEKKLSVSSKTLSLKPRTETGTVRQSFGGGRSKQVVVEVKKRRVPSDGKPEHVATAAASGVAAPAAKRAPAPRGPAA
ncbi:MAG TPA: translation initiation factor IF-2 associated domain-containing protein, partial [Xanthobacteraceae bacterium]|nr:translation initiation factor IF-2 associated domain-containing protein [Xanthobacteraceae bacterium]